MYISANKLEYWCTYKVAGEVLAMLVDLAPKFFPFCTFVFPHWATQARYEQIVAQLRTFFESVAFKSWLILSAHRELKIVLVINLMGKYDPRYISRLYLTHGALLGRP